MIHYILNLSLEMVVFIVFVSLAITSEIGFWAGKTLRKVIVGTKVQDEIDDNQVTMTNSALGLLALFLGFTFSSSLQHFEDNRSAVIDEANAIKTMIYTVEMSKSNEAVDLQRKLVELSKARVFKEDETETIKLEQEKSEALVKNILWTVRKQVINNPDSKINDQLISCANELIKVTNTRVERLSNGVPNGLFVPVGIFLLFNGFIMGLSLADGKNRHVALSLCLYFLIALSVAIIIDLDRPLKGLIDINQDSLSLIAQTHSIDINK